MDKMIVSDSARERFAKNLGMARLELNVSQEGPELLLLLPMRKALHPISTQIRHDWVG